MSEYLAFRRACLVGIVVGLIVVFTALVYGQVAYMERSRATPEVVVIQKTLADGAQICAEPQDGSLVACKSIGEFRKWVKELPKKY